MEHETAKIHRNKATGNRPNERQRPAFDLAFNFLRRPKAELFASI